MFVFVLFFYKVVELTVGGIVNNGATLSSFSWSQLFRHGMYGPLCGPFSSSCLQPLTNAFIRPKQVFFNAVVPILNFQSSSVQ